MTNRPTGIIRKIILGQNTLNGLAFTGGQRAGREEEGKSISCIVEDSDHYYNFGKVRYFIYYKDKAGEEKLWKSFVDIPVTIEYSSSGENNLV